MLRNAALASSVVASMPTVVPRTRPGVGQPLQHPREDRLVGLQVDPPSRSRYRRMVRRRLVQRDVQELPQAQRIGHPAARSPVPSPGLDVAEQQHPDLAARRQIPPADPVGVERRALALDEGIETRLVEDAIQSFVERGTSASRQVGAGHPLTSTRGARRRRLPIAMGRSLVRGIGPVDPYPRLSPQPASLV